MLWFSFYNFVKFAAQTKPKYKGQLAWVFEDKKLVLLVVGFKKCLDYANWGHGKYWKELLLLANSKYFGQ